MDKAAFGRRVAARRQKLGFSQGDLAQEAGMSQQGIDNIEHGKVARPRQLRELAIALATTAEWLLWKDGPEDVESQELVEILRLLGDASPETRRAALRYVRNLTGQKGRVA